MIIFDRNCEDEHDQYILEYEIWQKILTQG